MKAEYYQQLAAEWRDVAIALGSAHYVLEPDLRAAKHREALEKYSHQHGRDVDLMREQMEEYIAPQDEIRAALIAFMHCASTDPHMDGSVTITGWNPVKLSKAYERARAAIAKATA